MSLASFKDVRAQLEEIEVSLSDAPKKQKAVKPRLKDEEAIPKHDATKRDRVSPVRPQESLKDAKKKAALTQAQIWEAEDEEEDRLRCHGIAHSTQSDADGRAPMKPTFQRQTFTIVSGMIRVDAVMVKPSQVSDANISVPILRSLSKADAIANNMTLPSSVSVAMALLSPRIVDARLYAIPHNCNKVFLTASITENSFTISALGKRCAWHE
ncbi:hypothetical protein BGZ72_006329 [Mortierella alpina]|nr:hypothetical protein BGZ72_006329 [Mortierella alpina]